MWCWERGKPSRRHLISSRERVDATSGNSNASSGKKRKAYDVDNEEEQDDGDEDDGNENAKKNNGAQETTTTITIPFGYEQSLPTAKTTTTIPAVESSRHRPEPKLSL